MQKGKRYRGRDGTLYALTFDGKDYCLRESSGGSILLSAAHLRMYVQDGTLVELPDDDLDTYIDKYVEAGWLRGTPVSPQLRPSCTSHDWVNYTPYHDASPMAKFACRHCNVDKVK